MKDGVQITACARDRGAPAGRPCASRRRGRAAVAAARAALHIDGLEVDQVASPRLPVHLCPEPIDEEALDRAHRDEALLGLAVANCNIM